MIEPIHFVVVVLGVSLLACITAIVFKFLELRCRHEFETVDEYTVFPPGDVTEDTIPCGKVLVLRCKKCGDVIAKKLNP
jgi:hypothetical protein